MKLSKMAWWSAIGMVVVASGSAAAQDGPVSTAPPLKGQAQAQAVREYWTPDRMAQVLKTVGFRRENLAIRDDVWN